MLGIVATIKVKPGMEQQFEAVAKELAKERAKKLAKERGQRPPRSAGSAKTNPRKRRPFQYLFSLSPGLTPIMASASSDDCPHAG